MSKIKLGFCITGSFCTFSKAIEVMKQLSDDYDIVPIMSENAYTTDTRFGEAAVFVDIIEEICEKPVIHTIVDAEPLGPNSMTELRVRKNTPVIKDFFKSFLTVSFHFQRILPKIPNILY